MGLVNLFSICSPSGDGEGVTARSRSGVWAGCWGLEKGRRVFFIIVTCLHVFGHRTMRQGSKQKLFAFVRARRARRVAMCSGTGGEKAKTKDPGCRTRTATNFEPCDIRHLQRHPGINKIDASVNLAYFSCGVKHTAFRKRNRKIRRQCLPAVGSGCCANGVGARTAGERGNKKANRLKAIRFFVGSPCWT